MEALVKAAEAQPALLQFVEEIAGLKDEREYAADGLHQVNRLINHLLPELMEAPARQNTVPMRAELIAWLGPPCRGIAPDLLHLRAVDYCGWWTEA